MEEVIDSSHNNLWEEQTLPFPFLGDEGYYSKILKGSTEGLFLCLIARHYRVSFVVTVSFPGLRPIL